MPQFRVLVLTRLGIRAEAAFDRWQPAERVVSGVTIRLGAGFPLPVTVIPPKGDRLVSIHYAVSTALRNFHQVIVPDTGRTYSSRLQLVDFWASTNTSRINNVRMPVFILTGQDHAATLAFGVIGENVETDFVAREPASERALVAWMKRFTLEIRRGTEAFPLPDSFSANDDGSVTERIYFREGDEFSGQSWVHVLGDFGDYMAKYAGGLPRSTPDSLDPYWCSWTDWFSGDVTTDVILANVRQGVPLGIKNYIIDDGWFGPGLDSDFDVRLNIGDWSEDPAKIPDLKDLVKKMHSLGGHAVIWCAPHAVSPHANCFAARRPFLLQSKPGELFMTGNGYHPLCVQCPEARELMAELCADLIRRYDVDGAKYDLFNNLPPEPCACRDHVHDTPSPIEGLRRTLALIDSRTRALKPDYIVELKQNYATPYLHAYGTCVRAGDTPYNPEGNFLRTAFVNAYTPWSINDYQTITNNDTLADAAAMIVKMLAVGIPTYSMDLPALSAAHREQVAFFHRWYETHKADFALRREPLDPDLGVWYLAGQLTDVYFMLNRESRVSARQLRNCEILCGSFCDRIYLTLPAAASFSIRHARSGCEKIESKHYENVDRLEIHAAPGDILTLFIDRT